MLRLLLLSLLWGKLAELGVNVPVVCYLALLIALFLFLKLGFLDICKTLLCKLPRSVYASVHPWARTTKAGIKHKQGDWLLAFHDPISLPHQNNLSFEPCVQ